MHNIICLDNGLFRFLKEKNYLWYSIDFDKMGKSVMILLGLAIVIAACKKLEDYNGNKVPFEKTYLKQKETMTFAIPNDVFSTSWDIPCWSIPFGQEIAFEALIPAENPNPYAHLVYDIVPSTIKMELVGVESCDLSMLKTVEVFMVDKDVNAVGDIVFYDPNNPSAIYNAKKMGEYYNAANGTNEIPENIGYTMNLLPDVNIKLDEFIHDQDFKIYMKSVIDKVFVQDTAYIKTTLDLDVILLNEE